MKRCAISLPAKRYPRRNPSLPWGRGWQPDAASQVLLQKPKDALRAAATPRGVWKQLPLTALPLQNAGNDIARHLRGCDAMVLDGRYPIGSGADTLMQPPWS